MLFSLGDRAVTVSFFIFSSLAALVPLILIWNGSVMIRKEGFSLPNILSLLLGLFILVGEAATVFVFFKLVLSPAPQAEFTSNSVLLTLVLVISVSSIYISFCILMFVIYTVFLMLIPSGGQGSDETVSEAQAMKEYLVEKGIPEEHILLEDQSKTTYENLMNSKAIIDARESRKYTAIVTSNDHVFRALRYCRQIDFYCTGVGSKVAFYYWPSAVIREYIAVHAEKRLLITFIAGWLLCILPIITTALSR